MTRIGRYQALAVMVITLLIAAALRLPHLAAAPPGLHYDEAANGVLAADIGLRGDHPVFIASYTGKEVLFFYLAGGMMRLVGESVFALRITAAFVGILTVAAAYWLGHEMGLDRRVVLIAAILLAVSFWHLLFSRLGFRAITQPLLQALTLATLLHGLRRDRWPWLAAAGILLGLTAYTYLAARLFPVLLLLALLPLLASRQQRWLRSRQLLMALLPGVVVLVPLLLYFVQHPDAFWVRITQVAPDTAVSLPLAESFAKSLQMFFLVGDPYIRFNIPGRPLFNSFWGTLLVVGWLYTLWRWSQRSADWERVTKLLLLFNPLVMLLPTALATAEIVPSNLRAIGLIPLIFYLPGIGLAVLLQSLENWLRSRMVTVTTLAIGLVVLLLGSITTDRLYNRVWASDPDLYYASDGDLADAARFLDAQETEDTAVYVAALHYQHPTLAFLSDKYDAVKWLPGSQALVFPANGPALYIFPHNSPLPAWTEPYFSTAKQVAVGTTSADLDAFVAYTTAVSPTLNIAHATNINFGNVITLLGYTVETAYTGETMPLTLFWRVQNTPTLNYVPFVHLEDVWQYRWSQGEADAYPSAQWQPGDTIVQHVELPVPPGAPPGSYRLRIGLFNPDTGERLARLDGDGRYAGSAFILEYVGVLAGPIPDDLPQPPSSIGDQVIPGLRLLGYQLGSSTIFTGDTLGLSLWWEATQALPRLTTRLELLRLDNTGRILLDTQPVHGGYPFHFWYTPQFLIDHVDPRIPAGFPAGEYRLQLRVLDAENETLLKHTLGWVNVVATERLFTPPPMQFKLNAIFGGEIALLGYDVEATGEDQYVLRLVWQGQQTPTTDYTVFVHVLDADGVCCLWQQDTMPQQNQYPTTRWLPGEVVVDTYQITLPDGLAADKYGVEVGLYIAETGQRLQVSMGSTPAGTLSPDGVLAGDVVYVRPFIVED
ncbi:MAG: glycosyltransferase family 39 protein [Chloroflexota bacterium]